MTPEPRHRRTHRRLAVRLSALLAAALLVSTCTEEPVAPVRPGFGTVAVQPVFNPANLAGGLSIDNARLVVNRLSGRNILDKVYPWAANQAQLVISEPVLLVELAESLDVALEYRSQGLVLFSGARRIEVRQGQPSGTPPTIPVSYTLPDAAAITIAPRDSVLTFGDPLDFRVTAVDAQQQPMTQFYVSWSTSASLPQPIDATGRVIAVNQRQVVQVSATTPTGVTDTTTLTLVPRPTQLLKISGDQQVAPASTRLAAQLEVEVRAGDNLPVPGVPVLFAVLAGGGSVDFPSVTTDAQGRARTGAVLGPAAGPQQFTATVPNVGGVTFDATASGGVSPQPVTLAAGGAHVCRILPAGTHCWGSNSDGQLGDGTTQSALAPLRVSGGPTFVSVAAGDRHSCALTAAGQAFCWGDNQFGALGDGTTTDRLVPTAVSGGLTFTAITAGAAYTCGIATGGQAHCWGNNGRGNLGDGTTNSRLTPTPVSGGLAFAVITAGGDNHTCALTPAGQAYCWGYNFDGELGDGTFTDRLVPTPVAGGRTFGAISAATFHSCALDTGGAAFCWGDNNVRQLGDGSSSDQPAPVPVQGGRTYSAITAGAATCALSGSTAYCWGFNSTGQVGNGTTTTALAPVAVSGGFSFTELSAGYSFTCGAAGSTTQCWGGNASGQLGDGTLSTRLVPTTVLLPTGRAASIAANSLTSQTAPAGTQVTPPSVIIRDASGNPVPGVGVSFAVSVGAGAVSPASATTGPNGIASATTWTLGATPGANAVTATAAGTGISGNPVTFNATGTSAGPIVWTGNVSTDWFTAGNWNPAQVPGATDDVVIGVASQTPFLTANVTVRNLTVQSNLAFNGHTVTVTADFATTGNGIILMNLVTDTLKVTGNVTFGGGSTAGFLTAGAILGGANFTQLATTSGDAFHPSIFHLTVLTGATPTLSFATPGDVPGSSHFQELNWTGTGTLTLATDVYAHGTFGGRTGVASTIASSNRQLTVGQLNGNGLTFDNTRLVINQPAGAPIALSSVSFQNMATTAVQLTVNHPGTGGPFSFDNLTFVTVPTTGFYFSAFDTDGPTPAPLTIDVFTSIPTTGAPYVQALNGAVVNWPPASPGLITWTGATSTDWSLAGNWNPAQVPTSTNDVVIPAATPNSPLLTVSCAARSITVNSGAALGLNGFGCQVGGNVFADGIIGVPGFIQITAPAQIRGFLPNLVLTDAVTATNAVRALTVTVVGANARLIAGAQTLTIDGNFETRIGGTLVMTNSADVVQVVGAATFRGGDESTLLTAGFLGVMGDFTQINGSGTPNSFAASGSHLTVLNGDFGQTVSFQNPGQTASRFQELLIIGSAFPTPRTVTLATRVEANGMFTATGPQLIVQTTANPAPAAAITARGGLSLTSAIFDNTTVLLNTTGASPLAVSSVTFTSMDPTATQLSVTHPGTGGPFPIGGLTFATVPTTGFYLSATDADGPSPTPLTIDVSNTTPTSGAPYVQTQNGAIVNWPSASPGTRTWTGAVSTDWGNPNNWNPAGVPLTSDDVTVPAGPANQPTLSGNATVNDLNVAVNATLTLSVGVILTVTGNVAASADDMAGGVVGGRVVLTGGTAHGNFTDVHVTGPVSLTNTLTAFGSLTITSVIGGPTANLDLNDHILIVGGSLTTTGTGTLEMNQVNDQAFVAGNAVFGGGSEVGLLSDGILTINGDFSQNIFGSGGAKSFVASGNHTTIMTGDDVGIFFATPGSNESAFQHLQAVCFSGPVSFNSPALISGDFGVLGTCVTDLNDSVRVVGDVAVAGQGAGLRLNGQQLRVGGAFTTQVGGTVSMQAATALLDVGGVAVFDGGDETGLLTDGTLVLRGDLVQAATTSTTSFAPSGNHLTRFAGAASKTVSFATSSPFQSRFRNLDLADGSGPITLTGAGNFFVTGTLSANPSGVPTAIIGAGRALETQGNWNITGLGLNRVLMRLVQTTPAAPTFNNVDFLGYQSTDLQLTLSLPGFGQQFGFSNLKFTPLVTGSAGRYIRAINNLVGGNGFSVNVSHEPLDPNNGRANGSQQTDFVGSQTPLPQVNWSP